jgi:hypothetical protein
MSKAVSKAAYPRSSALSAEEPSGITTAPFVALKIKGPNHVALHDCSNLALHLSAFEDRTRRPNEDLHIGNSSFLGRHSEFGDRLAYRPSNKFIRFFFDWPVGSVQPKSMAQSNI